MHINSVSHAVTTHRPGKVAALRNPLLGRKQGGGVMAYESGK
ncbi:DUF5431 family protein [Erwinia sp. 198]